MSKHAYNHQEVEKDWYRFWLENNLFEPVKKTKINKNFSIILPPPNVTGKLHLGHAFDGALQDCMIRYKKLCGFRTIWIPGTDHAGIATQTKFEKILRDDGVDPRSLSRSDFVSRLMTWTKQQSSEIHNQWAKLGLALSYKNEVYTLDKDVKELVKNVFKKFYDDGLIYRGYRLVNWDVVLQTAISNIEMIYRPTNIKLYYIKYFFENSREYLTIATTRPETIYADCCVFVNPCDQRYKKNINSFVINPLNNKKLKILADTYVDKKFGTGVMKCTPAHDFNDYKLASKHKITNYVSTFNVDGTLNENGMENKGVDRFIARKNIIKNLKDKNYLIKEEDNLSEVAYSERTDTIVEPMLSLQWFVKMKPIATQVIGLLSKSKTLFLPNRFEKALINWLTNIEDWCISRQLIWGHQIPVFYDNKNKIHVGDRPNDKNVWKQDEDVLDTWFSSGLWPIALTLNKSSLKSFYPIDMLVTGYDILFFWVARMLFQCGYLTHKIPLKNIYFHGLIRDERNRKMSKSLNNGIDPMQLIEETGSDSLRMFLISTSTISEDLRFSREKIKYYWSFINKIWNAHNYIDQFGKLKKIKKINNLLNRWIINEFNQTLLNIKKNMDQYNFVVVNKYLIDFVWETFCNNYLELIRNLLKQQRSTEKQETIFVMNHIFKQILILLHPFIPFVSEQIYQNLYKDKKSILLEVYPDKLRNSFSSGDSKNMNIVTDIYKFAKSLRIKHNLKLIHPISINLITKNKIQKHDMNEFLQVCNVVIKKIVNKKTKKEALIYSTPNCLIEYFEDFASQQTQIDKLDAQLQYLNKEIERSKNILANKNFIEKAPVEKVNEEKRKYENYLKQHKEILETINKR